MTTEIKQPPKYTPITFSDAMVRALLSGKKTQTRRVIVPQPTFAAQPRFLYGPGHSGVGWYCCEDEYPDEGSVFIRSRYGHVGDRLWVREAWQVLGNEDGHPITRRRKLCTEEKAMRLYRADGTPAPYGLTKLPGLRGHWEGKWRSPLRMNRWASRITLELTQVRIQQLWKITEDDAEAEGVERGTCPHPDCSPGSCASSKYRAAYLTLFDSLNANRGFTWVSNPWVFALTFKRVEVA